MASLADQQSTYYRDPGTGHLMMPGSKRPDGSWRKPRRIKEGYVPQDEVPLYESKGKQFAKARDTNPIPGLHLNACRTSHLSEGILNMKIDTFDSRNPPSAVIIPGLSPDLQPGNPHGSIEPKQAGKSAKKKNKTKSSLCNDVPVPAVNSKPDPPPDPHKKLRNLRKKLRDIESLEAKIESGSLEKPEPEQLEKVARKAEVKEEIAHMEEMLA